MRTPALLASLFLVLSACSNGTSDGIPPHDGGRDAATDAGSSDMSATDGGGPDGAGMDGGDVDGPITDGGVDGGPVSMPCTPLGDCNPFDPSSCADAGACLPTGTPGNECHPPSPVAVRLNGEACAAGESCEPGTMCLDFGTGASCHQLCPMGSIGACSGADDRCYGTITPSGDACVQVCIPRAVPCDIYVQDCADTTLACGLVSDPETRAPYTGCRHEGTQADGQPCGGSSGACLRGLVCISDSTPGGTASCHTVCGADGGTPACPTGQVCTGLARTWGVTYCEAP